MTWLKDLGIPGVSNTSAIERTITADMLEGIDRIYVVQEPGKGGKAFPISVRNAFHKVGYQGKVYILNLHRDADGAKDPNELYKRDPKVFKAAMIAAMDAADGRVRAHPKPTIGRLCDLQAEVLPEPRWAIDPILPEGVTILGGKPKLGKSWLALAIQHAIASGGAALGQYPVERGEVLYISLEDNKKRLKKRANTMLDHAKESPDFYYTTDWARIDDGGLDDLRDWIQGASKGETHLH